MPKQQFKAESKRLLDLMINSIYTHKDIFLREIISNASDALDKLCYLSLTDGGVGLSRGDFGIDISIDAETRTIKISDNGIGMSKEDLEANLGTIAKSGSLAFKADMADSADAKASDAPIDIIGQFGVGFYSSFMVADSVQVISRAYGSSEAYLWASDGVDGYTITPAERDAAGTDVIITVKADTADEDYGRFLLPYTVERLIKQYSDYIRYPIRMEKQVSQERDVAVSQDETSGTTSPTITEITVLNSMVPIWQRGKSELTEDDYVAFYRDKFFDNQKPLRWAHVDAEGAVSYKALLYIPAKAGYDYFTREYKKGLSLYSSGVLIMEHCEDLLPEHFRFVRGVVDSPDLSLNISREILQHSRELKTIAANIEKKVKSELQNMLNNDREQYDVFYDAFGIQLKYGVAADFGRQKELLQDLLMFRSSNGDTLTTLAEYVERMGGEQNSIYYATGDSVARIAMLPQTELLRDKGYEILYFTDEVDEFAAQMIGSYKEKQFKSANSDDLDIASDDERSALDEQAEQSKDLLVFVKEALGGRVADVRLSAKLKSHAACLTASGGLSFEMEKYLKNVQPDAGAKAERMLELNAEHAIFAKLGELYAAEPDIARKYAEVLYNQAALMAGLELDDPVGYSALLFELL